MPDAPHLPLDDILQASRDPDVLRALQGFFEQLDRRIAAHRPTCRNRGDCCNFDGYGHQLRVTSLELAYFIAHHAEHMARMSTGGPPDNARPPDHPPESLPVLAPTAPRQCPFQQQGLCSTRAGRPLGCRVFFCESEREGWQQELTEQALSDLKALHVRFGVPYSYVDWMVALQECRSSPG